MRHCIQQVTRSGFTTLRNLAQVNIEIHICSFLLTREMHQDKPLDQNLHLYD